MSSVIVMRAWPRMRLTCATSRPRSTIRWLANVYRGPSRSSADPAVRRRRGGARSPRARGLVGVGAPVAAARRARAARPDRRRSIPAAARGARLLCSVASAFADVFGEHPDRRSAFSSSATSSTVIEATRRAAKAGRSALELIAVRLQRPGVPLAGDHLGLEMFKPPARHGVEPQARGHRDSARLDRGD